MAENFNRCVILSLLPANKRHATIYTPQMVLPVLGFSLLCSLPDDILRVMAYFMPPSGLLAMVQCSRRLKMVLLSELTRRMDGLFVATHDDPDYLRGAVSRLHYSTFFLKSIFGEENGIRGGRMMGGYHITEASKGYDGPPCKLRLLLQPIYDTTFYIVLHGRWNTGRKRHGLNAMPLTDMLDTYGAS
jgi:hypothetical protein